MKLFFKQFFQIIIVQFHKVKFKVPIGHNNVINILKVVHSYMEMLHTLLLLFNELGHNKFAIWTFLKSVITNLKSVFPTLGKVKVFSDGSAAHFKYKFTVSNLSFLIIVIFIQMENEIPPPPFSYWKGAVGGIEGMKSKAWTIVKPRQLVVNGAVIFFFLVYQRYHQ